MSTVQPAADPGPFSRFEFLVAWRYLRARRRDRFVSVIAALTLTGIALGVAALIVVTSVMNGFNSEIVSKLRARSRFILTGRPT